MYGFGWEQFCKTGKIEDYLHYRAEWEATQHLANSKAQDGGVRHDHAIGIHSAGTTDGRNGQVY